MKKTLLVVDDDLDVQSYYRCVLSALDLEMLKATNGREALDILDARKDVDLVLLDLVMPVMTGEEFFRILRQERKSSLPVVVCSVDGTRAEQIRTIGDVQGVVIKGCQREELVRVIGKAVDSGPKHPS